MSQPSYRESWVDRQIREAQERGEFDNLPGAGKPLGDLGDPHDPDWWIKSYVEREQLDISGALPPPLMLRREKASFPESLADVRTEAQAREVLEDYNRRVRLERLRPTVGPLPPMLVGTVDVEVVLEQWRQQREQARVAAEQAAERDGGLEGSSGSGHTEGSARSRRRWWRAFGRRPG